MTSIPAGARAGLRVSIPFLEPELPPLAGVMADFARIYASGLFSNGGPFERRFAAALADWLGVRRVVPVANATLGLILAARAVARPIPRGKVVLPSFTFVATALAVEWAGFEPVFCDVDPESWQAVPRREELEPLRDELALLLPCNTFGAPADIAAWKRLGEALGVPVLVDSAPGLGATYADGRRQGQSGLAEVFSLHATKTFATGEGGVITTDDDALAERLLRLRNFGFDDARRCQDLGLNAKMTELQAAISLRVLGRFDQVVAHRRARAAEYRAALEPLGFRFQRDGERSAYQFVPVRVPAGVDLERLRGALAEEGIETRDYFTPALHRQPHYAGRAAVGPLTVTEALAGQLLSLPMSNRLTAESVAQVCRAIAASLRQGASR